MQYSQEHLKTMVYAEFGGQTECIMGNWKIENDEFISLITSREKAKTLELFHNVAERRRTMQNGDLSSRSFCCWYSKDLNHFHVARLPKICFRLICSY